jgi:hypothetical protein
MTSHRHAEGCLRRLRRLAIIAISVVAIGITGLTASIAQAAAPSGTATQPVSQAAAQPLRATASAGLQMSAAKKNYFIMYLASEPPGGHLSYACNGGARSVIPLAVAAAELDARNNCSVRVWLYLNLNQKGRNLCVRPHSTAIIKRPYRVVWISRNTATC